MHTEEKAQTLVQQHEATINEITEIHDNVVMDLEVEIVQLNEKLEDEQNALSLVKLE